MRELPPPNIIKCMSEEDRKKLGLKTPEEVRAKRAWQHELAEQKKFRAFLMRHEIRFSQPRTDRKSTVPVGTLDFIVFCPAARTLIIEFKAPGKKLTQEQAKFIADLYQFGHESHICHYSAEAEALIKEQFAELWMKPLWTPNLQNQPNSNSSANQSAS